jgi:xanthine dehydrogenase accessory factor
VLELLEQIVRRAESGESLAFCTVVRTRGSTPQEKGAAMLVLADGKTMGTLGGGCVEAEVRQRALTLIQEHRSRLLTFRLDQDYGWDDGLVCGGIMDVAVQVIDSPDAAAALKDARDRVVANMGVKLAIGVADEQDVAAQFEIEIPPRPSLVIAGAGHVGLALARIARGLDFHITVIDDRPDYATAQRFPDVRCVVGDIEQELARLGIDEQTYIVIVTRGHKHDAGALAAVINSPARYLGLIGSKTKIRAILKALFDRGISKERLAQVHGPIGYQIGAVTPAEIAVSIAAELIAVRHGRADKPASAMKVTAEQLDVWLRE